MKTKLTSQSTGKVRSLNTLQDREHLFSRAVFRKERASRKCVFLLFPPDVNKGAAATSRPPTGRHFTPLSSCLRITFIRKRLSTQKEYFFANHTLLRTSRNEANLHSQKDNVRAGATPPWYSKQQSGAKRIGP